MTEKILDRVRKLLNLANDSAATEGERDNALRMAHATLMKYELTLEHLDQHQREKEDPRERMDTEGWNMVWCRQINGMVAKLFFCSYIIGGKINATRGRHIWVGRASTVATAAYMSEWIIRSIMKEADRLYKHRLTPQGREFAIGAQEKLAERVKEILAQAQKDVTATGSSLIVVEHAKSENDANRTFINKNMRTKQTNLSTRRNENSDAYINGREYGSKINLNKQLPTSQKPKLLK